MKWLPVLQLHPGKQRLWRNAFIVLERVIMNLGFSANQGSVIALSGVYHHQHDFSALSLWIWQLKKWQTEIIWGGELCPKRRERPGWRGKVPGMTAVPRPTERSGRDFFIPQEMKLIKIFTGVKYFFKLRAKMGLKFQWVYRNLSKKKRLNNDF